MKIIDAFIAEHGALYSALSFIDEGVRALDTLEAVQAQAALLRCQLRDHARLEDELLFAHLLAMKLDTGPLSHMHDEHLQIEDALSRALAATTKDDAVSSLLEGVTLAREHFEKEEELIFPEIENLIDDSAQLRLGRAWALARLPNQE